MSRVEVSALKVPLTVKAAAAVVPSIAHVFDPAFKVWLAETVMPFVPIYVMEPVTVLVPEVVPSPN